MTSDQKRAGRTLLGMIEEKDHATAEHSRNVARLSLMLGKACGLGDKELGELEQGALLHEADKLNVPDELFEKLRGGSALTQEDCLLLTEHDSLRGEIPFSRIMPEAVRHCQKLHHENYDGTGSAQGLRGEEIPLCVRILQVADTYDALTLDLPGRRGRTRSEALRFLRELSGTVLTPELVERFIEMMDRSPESDPHSPDFPLDKP